MQKKQLNLNAPLLSARRYPSPTCSSELVRRQSLPANNKPDSDHERHLSKPATIPFHWEHIPGRPKGEPDSQSHTPITPKLPPGRLSGSRYNSGERSNDQSLYRSQLDHDHAKLLEKLNESLNCKDESDSESGEDAFSDALDTLSPTGTCSINYSVSGISGYQSSGVKPSGTFSVDTQTRDFMMNRFLPAAKAVVVETPKKVVNKPSVFNELPKQIARRAVSGELKPSPKQYSSELLSHYMNNNNEESEDDEQMYNVPAKKPGKAWGILPRFCVKNSLCLLNPIPGMKSKSRASSPSTPREVKRLNRNAISGPLDKNGYQVPPKRMFHSGLLSRDLSGVENKFVKDMNHARDSFKTGESPLRRYRSGSISPYRNESPRSRFREGEGFLGVPNQVENHKIASSRKLFKALQDVSRNQINERGSIPVEKTVYIDSVNKIDLPIAKIDSSGERQKENNAVVKKEEEKQVADHPPVKSPLPPPLPKSPSESWLWRTLPMGNPFGNSRRSSHVNSKKQGNISSAIDTKWETIVKTSNLRHDHVGYSQELVPHRHRQRKV